MPPQTSNVIDAAVTALSARLSAGFDGSAKFVIPGEGAIVIDGAGVRADPTGDEAADVTMTADTEVFQAILAGSLSPTTAFMSGKLAIDGDMGMAMQLGAVLS